ncbi:MAG: ABC transporter permease [Clostridia bacterium]|nr:ABC transporter permease [Clostridia bacterium]
MNLLNKLTIKNLKLNKKRTIVTIIGIVLSVALITAVATMYSSLITSLIDFETLQKGNFHVAFYDVDLSDVKSFKNNRSIENIYITKNVGYAELRDSQNEYKPYIYIKEFTKEAFKNLSVKLVEGRLPENEDEIVIPTHLKTNGRVTLNVGDDITLSVGTRVSEDGDELTQSNPYVKEVPEKIVDTISKTYKIVGIIERPANNIEGYDAPGYTFITCTDENNLSGKVDAYTRYTRSGTKNYLNVTANILGVDEEIYSKLYSSNDISEQDLEKINKELEKTKYQTSINDYLILLETNPIKDGPIAGLGTVVAIVCIIIVFTSVFCIKNSFDISITEKIKQYGMLRSIGATKKQIKKNVFYEATILGIIGIPIGLLCGFLASYILVLVSNYFLNEMLSEGLGLRFDFSWIAVLVSVILGIVTIYFSALRSAKRAAKISPIDSIRNSADIKINAKKVKSPKIIKKLFGMGGEISFKNLKRNRRKYRTTVVSIVVSVFIFIALSYFMNLAFEAIKHQFNVSEYTLSLSIFVGDDEKTYNQVLGTTKLESIEEYSVFRQCVASKTNLKYSDEYKKITSNGVDFPDDNETIEIVTVGNEEYRRFSKKLGIKYDDVKNKGILIDYVTISTYDEKNDKNIYNTVRVTDCNVGDSIEVVIDDQKFSTNVGFITNEKPLGLQYYNGVVILVSDEFYDSHINNNNWIEVYYKSNDADKLQDEIDEILKGYDYSINNVAENVRMMENFYTLLGIFLYGFIIVISLIGITNIFNTITTNMELRRQEFAMLKSVGMTTKEFNRMIRLESVFMGSKSLVIGVPIGIVLCMLIYHYLGKGEGLAFELPIASIIIAIIAVFILITCIMKYSISKINKQNTIDTIRNENI